MTLLFICDLCPVPAMAIQPSQPAKAWCEEHWRAEFGLSDEARRQIAECSWSTGDAEREFSVEGLV